MELIKKLLKGLGLVPPVVDAFTNALEPIRPVPPLDVWARGTVVLFGFLSFVIAWSVAFEDTADGRRDRGRLMLVLLVAAAVSFGAYWSVSEHFPQHNGIIDVLQVSLWTATLMSATAIVVLCIDPILAKLAHAPKAGP